MNGGRTLLLLLGLAFTGCSGPGTGTRNARSLDRLATTPLSGPSLRLHVIDVGQGDAILIQTPDGKTALIDTGPAGARTKLQTYLRFHGVRQIDLLVHSHAHADHVGNTAALLKTMKVGAVLDPGFPHPAKAYARALDAIEGAGVPLKIARSGRTIRMGEQVTLAVLAPQRPYLRRTRSDVNANSVVLRVDYGEVRILLTGDAEHETEERLLARHPEKLRAHVLKVAHHGSKFATRRRFLAAVAPTVALISAGKHNAYGHPNKKVMKRLAKRRVAVATTARDGHLLLETDGRNLRLTRGHSPH